MAEQQLVDYIKKAKQAGQADDQTRSILAKSGWTEQEIGDAFMALNPSQPKPQFQPSVQPQPVIEPKIEEEPKNIAQTQPSAQPVSRPVQMPEQDAMPKARKSHLFVKLFMVLIILIVLGGIGYSVAGQYISLPYSDIVMNLFAPKPETVISKMMANMKNVKSSRVVTNGEIGALSGSAAQGKLTFSITADSDTADASNAKANTEFSLNIAPADSASTLASVKMRVIILGGAAYLTLDDFTAPAQYLPAGFDISQLKGISLKIDKDSITALSKAEGQSIDAGAIAANNDNSAMQKKIQDVLASENLFTFKKQLGSEVVSGQDTYHYLVTISKTTLEDILSKVMALQAQNSTTAPAESSPLVQNMAQAFAKTFLDAVGDIDVEMWIGKKDNLLYQAKIDKTVDLTSLINSKLEIKLISTSSNFNKPISVQAPADSQKIENVVLPLMKAQKITSDMNQIGFSAESLFLAEKSYATLCQGHALNGFLKDYGGGLLSDNNDMVSQGATKPGCFSAALDYCVSTQLSDGSYLCVDKTGALGKTKCTSASTACK